MRALPRWLILIVLVALASRAAAQTVVAGRDPLVDDGSPDSWSGLFVMAPAVEGPGGIEVGTVTVFNYWADESRVDGAHHVTPILVRRSEGAYRIHGIGTTRSPINPGAKSVAFGLAAGSDRVDLGDGGTYHIAVLQQWDGGDDNGGGLIPFGGSGGAGMFVQNTVGPNHVPMVGDVIGSNFSSGAGGRSYSFNFEVEFAADPQAPTGITLTGGDLFPALPSASEVGILTSDDPNANDTHTYLLVENPGGVFVVEGDRLKLAAPLGPTGTEYVLRIRTTDADGLSHEEEIRLAVEPDEVPSALLLSGASLNAGAPLGALVGTLDTVDGNAGDQHAYDLVAGAGDRDNSLFEIVQGSELRLAGAIPAGQATLLVRLRTTDLGGASREQAFVLSVVDPSFRLSEFVASNANGRRDADLDFPDWIEIFNEQDQPADLAGWYLTDDPDDLTKWQFPATELEAFGYLLVFASGKNRAVEGRELHTNFELSGEGDYLALVKPDGVTIADQFRFGRQFPDVAFGYDGNGTGAGFLVPTPLESNGAIFAHGASEVGFSHPRGHYDTAFELTLSATVPGSTIRYTTDGAEPGAGRGIIYSGPITIRPDAGGSGRGTRIIRAIALHDGAAVQPVVTHTYLFVNGVSDPSRDGIIGQSVLQSSITTHPVYGPLMDDAFLAQPAISIVGGLPGSTEEKRSVEFFVPDGSEPGFQVDCGMKVVGGHSVGSPKNNFRLYFRGEYGTSRLRYDLFKDHPFSPGAADVFDRLNLRSGSHDSFFWLASPGNPPNSGGAQKGDAQYLRNRWIGDMQFAMGHESLHGRWVHVFVNGTYHGHYHLHEWPNDDYLASYLPGQPSDYEYTNGASVSKSGSDNWQAAWSSLKAAASSNYVAAERWIDLENLADYQILNYYGGNPWDWNPNQNWMAGGPSRPRAPGDGWKFFGWDSDICLQDPGANVLSRNVPDGVFLALMNHEEFRILFRDRVYKHLFHDGVLTPNRVAAMHRYRAEEIRTSIIAETARWQGGAARAPWDRDGEWQAELDRMEGFFRVRTRNLLNQFRSQANWYPVDAPEFEVRGGFVAEGYEPVLRSSVGTIYYTTDGSDPRRRGGAPGASAQVYSPGSITIDQAVVIRARVRHGSTWSALNEAGFALLGTQPAGPGNVTISEIHYHPHDSDSHEFLEIRNTSTAMVDLTGVTISGAVSFTFPLGSVVSPGGHLVVVENLASFSGRYLDPASPWHGPGIEVAGEWRGMLDNDGEEVVVRDAAGELLLAMTYNDARSWPGRADGRGSSLELRDPLGVPEALAEKTAFLNRGNSWRASSEFHGSPGRDGLGPDNRVVFNEVLSNPLPPGRDAFELLNTGSEPVPIGGWFVSDDADEYRKCRLADGLVLAGGAFLVLDEDSFNNPAAPGSLVPFALNGDRGEDLYLLEADRSGNLLRFVDRIEFAASVMGETFGRWPDGATGSLHPMKEATMGGPNQAGGNAVRVGSMVVAEIHYNPDGPDEGREYIALCNAGSEALHLENWQLRGEVDFDFDAGTGVAPGAFLVVVGFDPADAAARDAFRGEYGLDPVVPMVGPWHENGAVPVRLDDSGGEVRLLRPGDLVVPTDGSPAFHPMLIEDVVHYDDRDPWPLSPDGAGDSLVRIDVAVYGDDPFNWKASPQPLGGASYATWAAGIFPEGTPEALRSGAADLDGDGISNFGEFAFMLDVLNGGGIPAATVSTSPAGNEVLIHYRTRPEAHFLAYEVGVSSDLREFDFSGTGLEWVSSRLLADGAVEVTMRYPLEAGGLADRYFQVRVTERP